MKIHRQIAVLLDRLLNAENVRKNLALVIGRAAGKNVAVFQNRLERRRIPELERIGRLHIVMAVDHDRAAARLMFVFRPDDRMSRRRNELRLRPIACELLHQPMRAFVYFSVYWSSVETLGNRRNEK